MIPYAVEEGLLVAAETELLEKIRALLDDFPDVKFFRNGKESLLSCHMFTRAIAAVFPMLAVRDGWFGRKGVEHSWLTTETRTFDISEGNIIDPYPVGQAGGAMLVWNGLRSPWHPLYIEAHEHIRVIQTESFLHTLEFVKRMVKRKAEVLKFIQAAG